MQHSKKLTRQIKKAFGHTDIEDYLKLLKEWGDAKASDDAKIQACLEALNHFPFLFEQIDRSYEQYEERLLISERNLAISSKELQAVNENINAMLDSLGQGFLLVGPDGRCLPIYSRACEELLQTIPAGKTLSEVLKIPQEEVKEFEDWVRLMFMERIKFEDLAEFGPKEFNNSEGRYIRLTYRPVRNIEGALTKFVVIATDRTEERNAKRASEERMRYADRVTSLANNRLQAIKFVRFLREAIATIRSITGPIDNSQIKNILRLLHTIKGGAGTFLLDSLKSKVHEFEGQILQVTDPKFARKFLLDIANSLESEIEVFIRDYGFVIGKDFERLGEFKEVPWSYIREFGGYLEACDPTGDLLNKYIEQLMAEPISRLIDQYNPVVRNIAQKLNKPVNGIDLVGEDIKIVYSPYDSLFLSFIHIFQNALDHGIESSDERLLKGKPAQASLKMAVKKTERGAFVQFVISDDGRGLDAEKIRRKMREMRPDLALDAMPDDEVFQMVFDSRLSTCDKVTQFSGRGVGLDAVKTEVERLGGHIRVTSVRDKGCEFTITVPHFWKISDVESALNKVA